MFLSCDKRLGGTCTYQASSCTSLDVRINVDGSIDVSLLLVIQLNAVSVALIPYLNDCTIDELANVSLDLVTNAES